MVYKVSMNILGGLAVLLVTISSAAVLQLVLLCLQSDQRLLLQSVLLLLCYSWFCMLLQSDPSAGSIGSAATVVGSARLQLDHHWISSATVGSLSAPLQSGRFC
jgi:hypothetical protein